MAGSVELLNQSKEQCKAALAGFKENHDLCAESGLFDPKIILSMDSCAIDFHSLVLTEITVARAASNGWLNSVLHFYQNICAMEKQSITDQLDTLGGQAKQLGLAFRVIAQWSRDLAGHLYQTYLNTQEATEHFVENFKQAVDDAGKKLDQNPYHNSGDGGNSFILEIAMPITGKPDLEALRNFEDAERREKKAEMIANKAAKLVTGLHALHTTTEAIAAFWTTQSDTFCTKGQKMKTDEIEFNKINLEKTASKEDIKSWEKTKSDFGTYVDVMSSFLNDFNYITDGQPGPTQEFKLEKLDLVLSVSSTINLKEILA